MIPLLASLTCLIQLNLRYALGSRLRLFFFVIPVNTGNQKCKYGDPSGYTTLGSRLRGNDTKGDEDDKKGDGNDIEKEDSSMEGFVSRALSSHSRALSSHSLALSSHSRALSSHSHARLFSFPRAPLLIPAQAGT
jgi:hypothetical protein